MSNFKLKHEDSENVKADRVNTVTFNLHQMKRRAFFLDTLYNVMHFQKNISIMGGVALHTYQIFQKC